MRSKLIFTLVLISIFFFGCNKVYAECSYKEQYALSELASNVKANYEVAPEPELYFTVNIYNLTSDLYINVMNGNAGEGKTYTYDENNSGNISFTNYEIYSKNEYKIEVYSTSGSCGSTLLRTISVVTPRYNPYYNTAICEDIKEYSLCQKWYDFEMSFDDLKTRIEEYKSSKIKEEEKKAEEEKSFIVKTINFIKTNYLYFIIGGVVVIGVIITIIIIIRKRRVL